MITLLTLLSILNFHKTKRINVIVTPIENKDIKYLFKENKSFNDEIYFTIEATQKAISEINLIKENKTVYIEDGSSDLIYNIVLMILLLIFITILII